MRNLREAWPAICDFSVRLDLPPSRWKYAWSTHELSAKRLYNAIRWRQPKIIVETGTLEGLGTFTMAKAAQENANQAKIFTIDYDGDPDVSIPIEDWFELRRFRDENLDLARARFPAVEIHFLNGDSRSILPGVFPARSEYWDFFFQDSMHFKSGILAEWEIMRPFARPGSVVVFDDVCLDWRKMPRHLLRRDDFCGHFLLNEAWRKGWLFKSTAEGRAQFWAQKKTRKAIEGLISMNAWVLIGFGTNVAIILMALAWAIARQARNASYLEGAWSYGFAVVTWIYALLGTGEPLRKWIIAGLVTIWSLRLGTSILFDVIRHHPAEGHRHAALREQFPKRPWLMFFGFSQYQAALLGLLSAPFAIACSNAAPGMSGWEVAGLILWLAAMAGETVATFQLRRFRSNQENSGKVCDAGLWRYSRHPDCFFEWLIWVAYFIFAIGSPWGWVTVYCPLIMLYFLTKVTCVPPAEARSVSSLGDEYRDYQRTTSPFFPAPPKPSLQSSETHLNEAGDA